MILKYLVRSNGTSKRSASLPLDEYVVPPPSKEIIVDNIDSPVELAIPKKLSSRDFGKLVNTEKKRYVTNQLMAAARVHSKSSVKL